MSTLKYTSINKNIGYKQDIDFSIIDLIELFNFMGYKTFSSCSGVKVDHTPQNNPYYYLKPEISSWNLFNKNNSGFISFCTPLSNRIIKYCRENNFIYSERENHKLYKLVYILRLPNEMSSDLDAINTWNNLYNFLLYGEDNEN